MAYDTADEWARALRALERFGIPVSDAIRDRVPIRYYPETTSLIHADCRAKRLVDCPRPFICAAMVSGGARLYTVPEPEQMAEKGYRRLPRFPVFHVPHDGRDFPEELKADVTIPEPDFMAYHEAMRDWDVRRLIPRAYTGDMRQVFGVSRLLCDVERLIGPEEVMERYGMGFCYEKAYDGTVIKRVTEATRAASRRYYDEHHAAVNHLCERHPRMIFFDMHSYHDAILPPFARAHGKPTPDLCIGTDPRFTPPALTAIIRRRFGEAGFTLAENEPYGGLYIPESVTDGSVGYDFIGVMLEFHRRTYCDGSGQTDQRKTEKIRQIIKTVMADCADLP
ncbi:MAG: N-formylglutamate amidohydrolase [Clostridia bacterium]|nr:N-formylglutamate amidohydrolase [Clostridia bacterium]